MSMYMLHTDVVRDLILAKSAVLDRRIAATAPQKMCISAVTRGELLCGLSQPVPQAKGRSSELQSPVQGRAAGADMEALRKAMHTVLARLTPQEAQVLRSRFGIDAGQGHSLEEIEAQFAAVRERLRTSERTVGLTELLDQFLTRVVCLPWDADAATHFAQIAVDLHLSGSPLGSLDTMIAGHAVAVGAVLVSNNERQFARIRGLKTENWTRGRAM